MNLETFFEKFELIAGAPGAIARMRGIILQLAVQGKLVPQDQADEPANKLFDRIRNERERLIVEGLIRRQKETQEAIRDPFYDIPLSWIWTKLGAIGDWGSGSTPIRGSSEFYGGGLTWLKSGELNDNPNLAGSEETVTELALKACSFRLNKPGDVLIAMYGATIGKVAILAEPAVTNQAVCGCSPFSGVFNRYLFVYLLSQRAHFHSASEGGAQPNISKVKIVNFPFPLPPFAEQKRIVAKVDELMALCDRLEAQQQERDAKKVALTRAALDRFSEEPSPANLGHLFHPSYDITPADLRKTILTMAVQGKLVPQDPGEDNSIRVLASLGLASTYDNFPSPFEIPPSWCWVRFEDVAITTGGVTLGRKLEGRKTISLPYLRVANVKRGEIDLGTVKEVSIAEDEVERYALRNGDLLMTEGGDWDKVGRAAIWEGQIECCLHQNHIFRSRMRAPEFNPIWFEIYFNSPAGRQYFESSSKQTTNLASINMRQVRGCPIPLPPLMEQKRILEKVNKLMKLVDQLEVDQSNASATSEKLLESVVGEMAGIEMIP